MNTIHLIFLVFVLSVSFYSANAETNTIKLKVLDDVFVTTDLQNIESELNDQNYGHLPYLVVSYLNNENNNEKLFSVMLLKFDLSFLQEKKQVHSAKLFLKPESISIIQNPLELGVTFSKTTEWYEDTVTFDTRPFYTASYIETGPTITTDGWHYWEIKYLAIEFVGKNMTLSSGFKNTFSNNSEQVIYFSKEANNSDTAPYLEIEYIESDLPLSTDKQLLELQEKIQKLESEIDELEGGGCLIATATYGSELAIQVQQLRELRDNHLLQTETGSAFMESFNSFYYSFSPYIADLERQSPIFKEIVKLGITPMISSLSILNHVDMDSEAEVLSYGIGIILLNVGMYFAAPAIVIMRLRK